LANLSLAIVAINGANRLNIVFRTVPGPYRAKVRAASLCGPHMQIGNRRAVSPSPA
jgi:hypothetical protein